MRLRDQGKLAEHNSTRQAVRTPHIIYVSVLMLLTGCSATLDVPQQPGSGGTTGGGPWSSPGNKWGNPVPGPFDTDPYEPVPIHPDPYYRSTYHPTPTFPGGYQSSYHNNYQGNRHDSARGSSFNLRITSTQ
jgi:hypothetical protein